MLAGDEPMDSNCILKQSTQYNKFEFVYLQNRFVYLREFTTLPFTFSGILIMSTHISRLFVIRNCLVISHQRWKYMIQVCLAYPTSNKRIFEHQMFLFSNECLFRNFRELTHCRRHPAEISLTLTKQFPIIVQGSV